MKKNLLAISLLTMTGLYVMLSSVIILVTLLCDIPVIYGIGTSIAILIIQFIISPFLTDLSMKWFYKAKFDYEIPEYLKQFVEEVCKKENMKYPRIGFIDDGAPNAFTYGHVKNNARIIITRGILELLDEEEAKAVVGHELGHAVHYDMLFMTVAQLVPLVLYGIYEILMSSTESSNSKNNSGGAIVAIIAYILYVISNYIILWLSRTREYYADSFSIEATKNPNSLASALVKIGYGLTTVQSDNEKHPVSKSNALGIFDSKTSKSLIVSSYDDGKISKDNIKQAMKWEEWNIWAIWFQLNSTHPLISKRLLAISSRSKEFNQDPYITFDLEKPESYLDDFLVELLINFLPLFSLVAGIVVFIIMLSLENDNLLLVLPITFIFVLFTSFIKFKRKHPNHNYKETTVRDLLSEVKVSGITAIPCVLEGEIIGRGDPGCIFNEDMTIKDSTGIIFLDYNQPLFIINKIFALFRNQQNIGKKVKVTGWYRRSPVPYVEIKTYELDGQIKKVFTYPLMFSLYIIGMILGVFFLLLCL